MSTTDSVAATAPGAAVIRPQHTWSTPLRVAATATLIVGPALQVVEEILESRTATTPPASPGSTPTLPHSPPAR
ncbi:hypothetical protein SAMN05444365_102228 [Micromonospora pattaloongensis]|uniref:Uncharacterized protein n=1 Tax=Micromonospora pattaloongensis TaxID=405436 RepID=A0A1H3JRU8_9ACTN|nr:hypothetical protein [Micromonospora pattaloongensis]SDY42611.1 hypothetical protein SAMN05444365_102228 [Micromonospora pattaloongensis]